MISLRSSIIASYPLMTGSSIAGNEKVLMLIKRVCCGILFFALGLISACSSVRISPPITPSTLDPHGTGASHIAVLWWVMFGFGTAVFLLVVAILFVALFRGRRGTSITEPESFGGDTGRNWPIFGGIVLPLVVIGVVFGYSIYTLAAIENPHTRAPIKIEIVGRRWWWEVKYPDQGITTANEIHIPVGTPVQIQLQSADVIHSFWVPELHGKMDLIPTRINNLTLQASQTGVYRGQCAEFCGLQHAHMGFMVVVESQGDFKKWTDVQQQPAAQPTDPAATQGQKVFVNAGCVFCHTVKGIDDKEIDRSSVDLGPDLTHLASRMTIAGASLTENRGNLAGWVVDPQHVKPGSLMPEMYLESEDLQNLLAYLQILH
jgi:cytochrome c oxidase subunit 2